METHDSYQAERADPDSLFVEVDGFRIHYKRHGTGATLILLLHGSFLSLRSWREVVAPLAEGATVVAFDRPVCGLTSRPLPKGKAPSPYSAEAQSALVADLIEALGFSEAILVGSSTGGTIAILTALRHPRRVRALVLVGAMIFSGYATSEVPKPVLGMMKGLRPLYARGCRMMWLQLHDMNHTTAADRERFLARVDARLRTLR